MLPEVIDADECAGLLRCSTEQVEEEARLGNLPGFKVGRCWLFVRADLLAFLAERARREAADRLARRSAPIGGSIKPKTSTRPQRQRPPTLPTLSS